MSTKIKSPAQRRKSRVRSKIVGVSNFPRLSVYRSNQHVYAQVITDDKGHTVACASDTSVAVQEGTKTAKAKEVGVELGKKILALNIKQVVFDRGSYKYEGRVKALAEGVREAGVII